MNAQISIPVQVRAGKVRHQGPGAGRASVPAVQPPLLSLLSLLPHPPPAEDSSVPQFRHQYICKTENSYFGLL